MSFLRDLFGDLPTKPEAPAMWRAASSACLLTIVAPALGFLSFPSPLHSPLGIARLFQMIWSATLLLLVIPQSHTPRLNSCRAVYALALLPPLVTGWIHGVAREVAGRSWEPLLRQKLIFIIIAVLSPGELLISVTLIFAYAVEAALEYWLGGLNKSIHIGLDEPAVTMLFALASVVVLVSRARHLATMQALRRRVSAQRVATDLARFSLQLRDLANTPLQTLVIGLAMMRSGAASMRLLERMDRALERIGQLTLALRMTEAQIRHPPTDGAVDPLAAFRSDGIDTLHALQGFDPEQP